MYISDDPNFVPVTIVDLERGTRADLVALYKHCMRMVGKDDHIIKGQTKDNRWLIGDDTNFTKVVDDYIGKTGATIDKRNAKPTTHLVLQTSPEYFRPTYHRDDPKGFGKYDQVRLDRWVDASTKWLKNTFGDDCVAAHLHVDERTCHVHAVIVPTFEKKPTMPRNKRKGESDERFAKRIERAKKKKSRIVVSHHKHHLFGAGRQSYEKVVDSYAEAMAPLGIQRSERGSGRTKTEKQEWARKLLKEAEAQKKQAELNILSMQRQQKLEDESFEFGSHAVIDEKIAYHDARNGHPEGLVPSKNWPSNEDEQKEIRERIKPARNRIIQFAKFIRTITTDSVDRAKGWSLTHLQP